MGDDDITLLVSKESYIKLIEALRAENANLRDDITSINIAYDKLYEESARLREALKPFANLAADEDNGTASEAEMWFVFGAGKHVTIGDLRAARAAMGESDD